MALPVEHLLAALADGYLRRSVMGGARAVQGRVRQPMPPLRDGDALTTCADHTVCPEGYLSWHAWAEKKARRHYQVRCDECGLWAIWRRKCRHAIYHHGCPSCDRQDPEDRE